MPLPVGRSGTVSFLRLLREVLESAAVASTVSRQNSTSASSQSTASSGSCSSSSTTPSPNGTSTGSTACACLPSGTSSSSSLGASTPSHPPFARLHTNAPLNSPRGASAAKATSPNSSSSRPDANHLPMHMLTVASGHAHSHNGFNVSSSGAAASNAFPQRFASLQNDIQKHQIRRKWVFGDDACFIAHHKLADVIGVADGVGGWRSYGIDPSRFSSTLMSTCARLVQEGRVTAAQPAAVLAAAYYEILDSKASLIGSCTACIISFNRADRTLYSANLGDSGFLVLRATIPGACPGSVSKSSSISSTSSSHLQAEAPVEREDLGTSKAEPQPVLRIVHRSRKMQHYFNAPHQLAVEPAEQRGLVISDRPEAAEQESVSVCEGDIILLATDGLFDNLHESAIIELCAPLVGSSCAQTPPPTLQRELQRVADALVRRALELSEDPAYVSPFALEAREHGLDALGGKPDDITLLLAKVRVEDMSGARASASGSSFARNCASTSRSTTASTSAATSAASASGFSLSLSPERSSGANIAMSEELSSSAASLASVSVKGGGASSDSYSYGYTMPKAALPSRASASAADSSARFALRLRPGFGLGASDPQALASGSALDEGQSQSEALSSSAPSAADSSASGLLALASASASASASGLALNQVDSELLSAVPKRPAPEPALLQDTDAAAAALCTSSEPHVAATRTSSNLPPDFEGMAQGQTTDGTTPAANSLRSFGSAPTLFVLDEDYTQAQPSMNMHKATFGPF